jgi:hypothetical protein
VGEEGTGQPGTKEEAGGGRGERPSVEMPRSRVKKSYLDSQPVKMVPPVQDVTTDVEVDALRRLPGIPVCVDEPLVRVDEPHHCSIELPGPWVERSWAEGQR